MNRVVVIKTIGDADMAGAIVDGMSQRVIPLNNDELAVVKAEYAKLQAKEGVRAYGDSVRYETAIKALEEKYAADEHGAVHDAILGIWAMLWEFIYGWVQYFQEWNRA